jgi:hypothetical protein
VSVAAAALLGAPWRTRAAPRTVGTFRLDGLSFVSFGDQHFAPGGVLDDPVSFRQCERGRLGRLHDPARGRLDRADPAGLRPGHAALHARGAGAGFLATGRAGAELEFDAAIAATLEAPEGSGSYTCPIPFATGTAAASNAQHTDSVSVSGMRLVDGVWYAQIVGATTNKENAYPAPGTAVYTVLSGTFDQVP